MHAKYVTFGNVEATSSRKLTMSVTLLLLNQSVVTESIFAKPETLFRPFLSRTRVWTFEKWCKLQGGESRFSDKFSVK